MLHIILHLQYVSIVLHLQIIFAYYNLIGLLKEKKNLISLLKLKILISLMVERDTSNI